MVRDGAQLYTMEGIAAGLIMLITAYLVLGSTSVYTPGDTHITDMQLEQVGSDILKVMDTPLRMTDPPGDYRENRTDLELLVNKTDAGGEFYTRFRNEYLYNGKIVAKETTVGSMAIQINASVWYRGYDNTLGSYTLATTPISNLERYSGKSPGVRVTRWVLTYGRPNKNGFIPIPQADYDRIRKEPQEMLVEVLMWKI